MSVVSDRPPLSALARDVTPLGVAKVPTGPPSTAAPVRAPNARNKRSGGRKSQAQDLASVDGDEGQCASDPVRDVTHVTTAASAAPTRKANSRARGTSVPSRRLYPLLNDTRDTLMPYIYPRSANNSSEHPSRRAQNTNSSAVGNNAASRAYHQSHAYAVSQQPLLTSWNLPDYLAHLESLLPSDVPRPLEVRGTVIDANQNLRETQELTTERGVKVKWPGKRMSVVDMNKRVRSLVEWVGREQAAAMERVRRKEALEKALRAQEMAAVAGEGGRMDVDAHTGDVSVPKENGGLHPDPPASSTAAGESGEDPTMKMMEELMEELIRFQEQYGPGAKAKERDRRAGTL